MRARRGGGRIHDCAVLSQRALHVLVPSLVRRSPTADDINPALRRMSIRVCGGGGRSDP